MEEYIMNQETLTTVIDNLRECVEEINISKTKKKFLAEIKEIESTEILTEAWAKLLTSKVFNKFIGSWEKVIGNVVFVQSVA
jgi:hypothetical protein